MPAILSQMKGATRLARSYQVLAQIGARRVQVVVLGEDDRPVGILTDRDIVLRCIASSI